MIFLRHPETDAGPDICYGQSDIGLGPVAEGQIAAALAAVPPVKVIHSSDLSRCRILAERFAARDGVDPIVDPRLREYDFGAWEGRRWGDIPRHESDPWSEDLWGVAPPGGETFAALHARVAEAMEDIAEGALVVCHAGVIRAARMILTGVSFETVFADKVPFCEPLTFGGRLMARVSLILGGARSGKSARALALATAPRTFVATAEVTDDEMAARVAAHKAERGPDWGLIEAPLDIAGPVRVHGEGTVVIDCLTLWLNNLIYRERDVPADVDGLCEALGAARARVILVSNEVGLSIAPENALARRFRDEQGRLNQRVAGIADHVEFMAAGLPMTLKGAP